MVLGAISTLGLQLSFRDVRNLIAMAMFNGIIPTTSCIVVV